MGTSDSNKTLAGPILFFSVLILILIYFGWLLL